MAVREIRKIDKNFDGKLDRKELDVVWNAKVNYPNSRLNREEFVAWMNKRNTGDTRKKGI